MDYRVCPLVIMLLFINSSVYAKSSKVPVSKKTPTMMDVYVQGAKDSQNDVAVYVQNNLQSQQTFGYVEPYMPVMQGPVVRKVWVPDQKAKDKGDVLIAGHWVYVMVEGPRWFIDHGTSDIEVPVIVPAPPVEQKIKNKEGV